MTLTYQETKQLHYCVLRMPKDDAYFVYFTLESNEGLCFYSTLDESLKGQYRDMVVQCPVELSGHLKDLIRRLQLELRLDVLEEKIIQDS
jgi:hypothetical protein